MSLLVVVRAAVLVKLLPVAVIVPPVEVIADDAVIAPPYISMLPLKLSAVDTVRAEPLPDLPKRKPELPFWAK